MDKVYPSGYIESCYMTERVGGRREGRREKGCDDPQKELGGGYKIILNIFFTFVLIFPLGYI